MKRLLIAAAIAFASFSAHAQYRVKDIDAIVALHERAYEIHKRGEKVTDFINKDGMALILLHHSVVRAVAAAMAMQKCVPSKTIAQLAPGEVALLTLSAIQTMHNKKIVDDDANVAEWIGLALSSEFSCSSTSRQMM